MSTKKGNAKFFECEVCGQPLRDHGVVEVTVNMSYMDKEGSTTKAKDMFVCPVEKVGDNVRECPAKRVR